jgi:hypothetical protein
VLKDGKLTNRKPVILVTVVAQFTPSPYREPIGFVRRVRELLTEYDELAHRRTGAGGRTVAVAEAVAEEVAVGIDAEGKADLETETDATDREADTDLEGEKEATDRLADTLVDEEAAGTQNIKSVASKLGEYMHPYEAPCSEQAGPFTISHPGKRDEQIASAFAWINAHVGSAAHDVATDIVDTEYPFTLVSKANAKAPTTRSIYFSMRYKREV